MRVTDDEASRNFYRLRKLSEEWPLLNNVTWNLDGAIFTYITFGSYIIITLGLLIGYLTGELKHGRIMEKFFLGIGALVFIIVGSLVYASLESVPPELVKNSAILGTLALLTGLLFLLDIGLSRPKPPPIQRIHKTTQTETASSSLDLLDKVHRVPNGDTVIRELRSSLKDKRRPDEELREPLKLAIGIPLLQSLADFDRTISSLTSVPGNVGDKVNEKTANILSKNPGYYQLKEIQDILEGKRSQKPTKFSIELLTTFVQAPLTSCDVERSFSRYKAMLRDNRRRMTTENVRDSTPDLTHQGNGRRFPASARVTPEEQTPNGYQRNGHVPVQRDIDHRRHGQVIPENSMRHELQFPSDIEIHPQRVPRDHPQRVPRDYPETNGLDRTGDKYSRPKREGRPSDDIPIQDQDVGRHRIPLQEQQRPSERHLPQAQYTPEQDLGRPSVIIRERKIPDARRRTSEHENSNSSSGEQRYLEQSEISQRPESITPEQAHKSRPREMYRGSDSEVDDLMHIPTVSFLLTERGERVEVKPGDAERRMKSQRSGKGSVKGTKLLPMVPIASTSEDKGLRKTRSEDSDDETKQRRIGHEERLSPASVPDEREKERYLFGNIGKSKTPSSRSLDIEAGRLGRFEGISKTPSPEVGHWRYDSRDANLVRTEKELPASPSDPGFVRHAAHNWPDSSPRTPSQSPQNWSGSATSIPLGSDSRGRTPSQSPQAWSEATSRAPSGQHVHWSESHQSSDEGDYAIASPPPPPSKPPVHHQVPSTQQSQKAKKREEEEEADDDDPDMPSGGSLTTQLLQKWLKQRKSKIGKAKSNP
ncbi:hypothetical protein ANN_06313 [Periplaneta americana]|uniref:Uncharacterized protein n=1 Tax=Periplaneta americana TaxID=6978 RepID=A0ABQ8TDA8_PERAM|nr:hypothetical protein ANN_06313 [Periplaneta americana]